LSESIVRERVKQEEAMYEGTAKRSQMLAMFWARLRGVCVGTTRPASRAGIDLDVAEDRVEGPSDRELGSEKTLLAGRCLKKKRTEPLSPP